MATIRILYLKYKGDSYFYESPYFKSGLNIIQGHNGAGKTTFISLIYYCLGGSVAAFTDEKNKQIEIYNDQNNIVEVGLLINKVEYIISRYIKNNTIAVRNADEIEVYPVYRINDEKQIFSDWLLDKLEINVFSIYQGPTDWKINFLDLIRLIYHDQAEYLGEIYKKPDKKENFINDSRIVKKAVFEVLIGHNGDAYYKAFNKLKEIEKEKNMINASYQKYKEIAENLRYNNDWKELNLTHIDSAITEIKKDIYKLNLYKDSLRIKPKAIESENIKIEELKKDIILIEDKLDKVKRRKFLLSKELLNINDVYNETLHEINTLEKILYTHETYSFFHSNTCPICLKESKHSNDLCICGNAIEEEEKNTIFYESDEYLELLNSKKKSIETIQIARSSCLSEIEKVASEEQDLNEKFNNLKDEIKNRLKTIDDRFDNSPIIKVEKEIIKLSSSLNSFMQQRKIEEQLLGLENQLNSLKSEYKTQNAFVNKLAAELEMELNDKINSFNKIYNKYLTETLVNCRSAFINDEYYPVINGGSYQEASAVVPIRLMYYLTLLKLSVERNDILFPKFLIIDTPETAGIDLENLLKCLKQIKEIIDLSTDFQIILTTGLKKYPDIFNEYVLETINEGKYLLKRSK